MYEAIKTFLTFSTCWALGWTAYHAAWAHWSWQGNRQACKLLLHLMNEARVCVMMGAVSGDVNINKMIAVHSQVHWLYDLTLMLNSGPLQARRRYKTITAYREKIEFGEPDES